MAMAQEIIYTPVKTQTDETRKIKKEAEAFLYKFQNKTRNETLHTPIYNHTLRNN